MPKKSKIVQRKGKRKNPLSVIDQFKSQLLFFVEKLDKQKNENTLIILEKFLKNASNIDQLGIGRHGIVYLVTIRMKNETKSILKNYTLKILFNSISKICYKNLEKYSKMGLIPKIYELNSNFIISDYVEGMTFTKFKHQYIRGKIPENVYKNIIQKRENALENFPKDENLDIRKTENMIVTSDFKNVVIIDPCW